MSLVDLDPSLRVPPLPTRPEMSPELKISLENILNIGTDLFTSLVLPPIRIAPPLHEDDPDSPEESKTEDLEPQQPEKLPLRDIAIGMGKFVTLGSALFKPPALNDGIKLPTNFSASFTPDFNSTTLERAGTLTVRYLNEMKLIIRKLGGRQTNFGTPLRLGLAVRSVSYTSLDEDSASKRTTIITEFDRDEPAERFSIATHQATPRSTFEDLDFVLTKRRHEDESTPAAQRVLEALTFLRGEILR